MALTPEDVVNKRFQSTKFREGYDQDEVDDFLDEIVIELRRLGQENEELRQRLVAGDARIAELQRAGGSAPEAAPVAAFAEPVVETPAPAPVQEPAPLGLDDPNGTNNLLQLARRLHEEHVRDGVAKRDALIAEGESRAAAVVAEAEERSGARVAEVEERIAGLQQEREGLERSVDELRSFEREYRSSLKGFIEGQLRDLESSESSAGDAPAAPQGSFVAEEVVVDEQPAAESDSGEQPTVDAAENPFAGFGAPETSPFGAEPTEQNAPPTGWGRPPQAPFTGFGGN